MRVPKITRGSAVKHDISTIKVSEAQMIKCVYVPDVDMDDEKSVERYVRNVKGLIRASDPYKDLMTFLKYNYDMDTCYYLPNVRQNRGEKISIEQHHMGLTITDIIDTVLRKRVALGEDYQSQEIAKEVMFLHYQGKVSLVPLSTTVHELIHADNSELFIPLQHATFGDCSLFYEEYKEHMTKELKNKYEKYATLSEAFDTVEDLIPDYMNVSIIYYECEGVEIPRMDKLIELLENVA